MPKYWATPAGKKGPPAPYLNDRTIIPAPNEWRLHHQPPMPKFWDLPPTPYVRERPQPNYWPAPDPSVPARSATAIYGRQSSSQARYPVDYGAPAALPVGYGAPPVVPAGYGAPAALPLGYGAPPPLYFA
eukprot:GGOE01018968.1.p3 GENE.GGOE01018968.1~~GGOE01018968.1.p3  ORF type:complete len:148 (-),score=18.50 GGOE01018968.1:338-727(-)